MRFALEEVNRRYDLLPNITMGFQVYDTCAALRKEMVATLQMLAGQTEAIPNYSCQKTSRLAAVLGHSLSMTSIHMAHMLGLYRFPQISHYSTSSALSDRTQFPSFFRTVPSDSFQSQGLAQLVLHFGWNWVGLIATGNDNGIQGIQVIKQEILKAGACVAFTEFIQSNLLDKNIPFLTKVIKNSSARVVVIFSNDLFFALLLDEMIKQNVTGKTFVASETWSTSTILLADKYSTLLAGSIGFAFHSSTIPGFRQYLTSVRPSTLENNLSKAFWERMFGCKFNDTKNVSGSWNGPTKICTGNEDLQGVENVYTDVSSLRSSYNIYTSVQVIAKALHDLYECEEGRGPFYRRSCASIKHFKPWQLRHYLQNVHVQLSNGREVLFDRNGDLPAVYDIVNWQLGLDGVMKQIKVGSYDITAGDGNFFTINIGAVKWATGTSQVPISVCRQSCPPGFRKAAREGEPVCCSQCVPCPQGAISNETDSVECLECSWDTWPNSQKDKCLPKTTEFLSYEEPLGTTLTATSAMSSTIPISILGLFIHYKNTPIVRANNYSLSCLLLVSISLCFLSSLNFIGSPQVEKCLIRQVAFGMVFALCISCILAKTVMVVFAFMATKPDSSLRKWTNARVSYVIVLICSLVQFILCMLWISISPPFPEKNIITQPGIILLECNEGSPTAFWCMLGYLGLLSTISFVVAFLARRLPDSFNEAKFITFSMLAFLSVWVSYIPASVSTRGQYVVAMEVFAILSSSWALVLCMFAPKCFIIIFRPNMNSREHLLAKDKS
ncbi:extracellular calcium-sensing receptor-like [Spea bombifrons]|uniref:extracellular calcium-sensing receptor-like n=1 Tax=Spea bombifrons TaxID=233779 RepID=UPI002348F8A5|nr:extracellular calcium-sensing receptor-like [Spea bombifrons]